VTDHRLKMNFELASFLSGDIDTAIEVNYLMQEACIYVFTILSSLFFGSPFFFLK